MQKSFFERFLSQAEKTVGPNTKIGPSQWTVFVAHHRGVFEEARESQQAAEDHLMKLAQLPREELLDEYRQAMVHARRAIAINERQQGNR